MEEKSLRITGTDVKFFSKISNTLTRIMEPTRESINSLLISGKRNNLLKAYESFVEANANGKDTEAYEKRYESAYTNYLEVLDKYVLNSIYKKVKLNTASEFQKRALSEYYGIVQLKESEFTEYKSRKQKYLLELDNENVRLLGKEKLSARYKEFYLSKMDELYKKILKNYSIKLADTTNVYDISKEETYTKIFSIIEDYIRNILTIKMLDKNNVQAKEVVDEYEKYEKFMVGKLDVRDTIEKNLIILGISRKLFTHSLPLVAAEQCYLKLLKDARSLVQDSKIAVKREKAYQMLINLIEDYYIKLLSSKVYWEELKERERFKKFYNEYQEIQKLKNVDFDEYIRRKEVLFIKEDIVKARKEKQDYTQLIKYYKRRLVDYDAMKELTNKARTMTGVYKKIKEEEKCIN